MTAFEFPVPANTHQRGPSRPETVSGSVNVYHRAIGELVATRERRALEPPDPAFVRAVLDASGDFDITRICPRCWRDLTPAFRPLPDRTLKLYQEALKAIREGKAQP